MSDRMVEALIGEKITDLPPFERAYFEQLCADWEAYEARPEPIRADPAYEDFHGHDRADERRWREAELGKYELEDMDPYERMVEG